MATFDVTLWLRSRDAPIMGQPGKARPCVVSLAAVRTAKAESLKSEHSKDIRAVLKLLINRVIDGDVGG